MKSTLEILLVLGIVINLVKGADLLLRPHQAKWVQNKWESLTLWLDYTKPIDWFFKGGRTKGLMLVLYLLLFPWFVYYMMSLVLNEPLGRCWTAFYIGIFYLVSLANFAILSDKKGPGAVSGQLDITIMVNLQYYLFRWLKEGQTVRQQVVRLLTISCLGTTLVLLYLAFGYLTLGKRVSGCLVALFFQGLLVSFSAVLAMGFVSSITLLVSLGMFIVELVLKLLRGIAWRIAEYNKGALAAIMLLITVSLGLAEVWIKFKGK